MQVTELSRKDRVWSTSVETLTEKYRDELASKDKVTIPTHDPLQPIDRLQIGVVVCGDTARAKVSRTQGSVARFEDEMRSAESRAG